MLNKLTFFHFYLWPNSSTRWPNPEQSTGTWLGEVGKCSCWELVSLARQRYSYLQIKIDNVLKASNLPPELAFNGFMIGESREKSEPTVLFFGADKSSRNRARLLVEKSGHLQEQDFIGFRTAATAHDPGLKRLVAMKGGGNMEGHLKLSSEEVTFWRHRSTGNYVIVNSDPNIRAIATISGNLHINDRLYLFTSAHVLTGSLPFPEWGPRSGDSEPLEFEELHDEGVGDPEVHGSLDNFESSEEGLAAITSLGSLSSHQSSVNDSSSDLVSAAEPQQNSQPSSTEQLAHRSSDNAHLPTYQSQDLAQVQHEFLLKQSIKGADFDQVTWPSGDVMVLLGSDKLDYALIYVPEALSFGDLTRRVFGTQWHHPEDQNSPPPAVDVIAQTSSPPSVPGRLLGTAMSMMVGGGLGVRHIWAFKQLSTIPGPKNIVEIPREAEIRQGDSGAWVIDIQSKKLYGHIVAGDPASGMAYVIPSCDVFAEINLRFGEPIISYEKRSSAQSRSINEISSGFGPRNRDVSKRAPRRMIKKDVSSTATLASDAVKQGGGNYLSAVRNYLSAVRTEERVENPVAGIGPEESLPNFVNHGKLSNKDSIRLLRLEPASSKDVEVEIAVLEIEFQRHAPGNTVDDRNRLDRWNLEVSYEAISWVWGDAMHRSSIRVRNTGPEKGDGLLEVPAAAVDALRAMRHETTARFLWMDVICIDQTNAFEKAQQVTLIPDIFRHASRVCVWLGDGSAIDGGPQLALDFMKNDVLSILRFDDLVKDENIWLKREALRSLLSLPWFSRRWIVQEITHAQDAVLYCGDQTITWREFSYALSRFATFEAKLRNVIDTVTDDSVYNHLLESFDQVPELNATRLVDVVTNSVQKSGDSLGNPLMSLEYLVSALPYSQASIPHDCIYALLSIARDVIPRTTQHRLGDFPISPRRPLRQASTGRSNLNPEVFYVDYGQPYSLTFKDFVEFAVRKAQPQNALNILCRPWAPSVSQLSRMGMGVQIMYTNPRKQERREELKHLPSWISTTKDAPFEIWDSKMVRANADPLVGLPDHSNYAANGQQPMNAAKVSFKTREEHYSMFIEGFVLDQVSVVGEIAREGNIPETWLKLGGWTALEEDPPDALWRTVIADRGPHGDRPSLYYRVALKEAVQKGLHGRVVPTKTLIHKQRGSFLVEYLRRVQEVIWNRSMLLTESGRLGLAREDTKPGHLICILYGCTVPVVLERYVKSDKDLAKEKEEDRDSERTDAAIIIQRYYRAMRARRRRIDRLRAVFATTIRAVRPQASDKRLFDLRYPYATFEATRDSVRAYLTFVSATTKLIVRRARHWLRILDEVTKLYKNFAATILSLLIWFYLFVYNGSSHALVRAVALVLFLIICRLAWAGWSFIGIEEEKDDNAAKQGDDETRYYYKVIGECYVHGMMDGEAIAFQNRHQGDQNGEHKVQIFELR
ncbi:HET-domain-containing protein [Rhizodiscina lignyota]|uniref:HET-domain-containing protein n=1 Tax=Rhizodiscina lignyota TaxID=1504668 RepID=A0A9P4I625_9PEZI|nr:HET-domain-containing protein [Rhizodiscina lignyota]